MTGQRYIDEVLLPHVRLFRGAVGDKFVFMDDNATSHRTLDVQDCLDSEGIQRLVWPACSPDLNPIENVWDALGRQVAGRNYPPTIKNTHIRALTDGPSVESGLKVDSRQLQSRIRDHDHKTSTATLDSAFQQIRKAFLKLTSYGTVGRNFRYALPVTVSDKRKIPISKKEFEIPNKASIMHIWLSWHLQATGHPIFDAKTYLFLYVETVPSSDESDFEVIHHREMRALDYDQ
ncbi:transposable element Tc1 transposase [Trichonephila clavipes]|nr:transposable element Tc1 transposase [Trichonephila clavipes]